MKLVGKNVLITGGSRGIGRAISLAMIEEGARLAFTYSKQSDAATELLNRIKKKGSNPMQFQCDVRDRKSWKLVRNELSKRWGKLDVLINNAGINNPSDFENITDNDWDEILSVNLKGPFVTTQELLPLLKKSGNASIINIGSVSGQYGGPRTAHYAASKAGLISLSQVIARYGASFNIRCNTLSLGLIDTDMAKLGLKSASVANVANSIILKRLGNISEVAKSAVFLASDDSSYITAQTINVNGGLYF